MQWYFWFIPALCLMLCNSTLECAAQPGTGKEQANRNEAKSRPDYSRLTLKGEGMWHDSLSMALVAAARLFGRSADYETLYCRSGNAFAPAIDPGEDCTAHWHCEAGLADREMAELAASLGLKAWRINLPVIEPEGGEAPEAGQQQAAMAVRGAMDSGAVVLVTGGWEWQGVHGFTHWAWAGIVTEADPETGVMRGAHPNGFTDNVLNDPYSLWALRPIDKLAAVGDSERGADRQMLRAAVNRVRGKGRYRPGPRCVFGLDAMERWAQHMRTVKGFCAPCYGRDPKSSLGDAMENARHMRHGAEVAAAYLRTRWGAMPLNSRPYIEQAARRYDRIAALLVPLCADGDAGYSGLLGNLAKQRDHADSTLVTVKEELAMAACDFERALAAWDASGTGTAARVTRGRHTVMAPGLVEAMKALPLEGRYFNNRHTRYVNMAAVLSAAGAEGVDFERLLVLSGFSTAFGYQPDDCAVMYQTPEAPDLVAKRISRSIGIGWEWLPHCDSAETAFTTVRTTVDSGVGLLGKFFDDIVVAGYRDDVRPQNRQVYVMGGWDRPGWWNWTKWSRWVKEWGSLGRPGERCEPAPERDIAREVIGAMERCAEHDGRSGVSWLSKASLGLAGIDALSRDLDDSERPASYWSADWRGCHAIYRQITGRSAASRWLRRVAPLFEEPVRKPLLAAAGCYEAAWQQWMGFSRTLGQDTGYTRAEDLDKLWADPEKRKAAAHFVREAATNERSATDWLRRALATMGEK